MTQAADPMLEARRLMNGFRSYQLLVAACRLKLPDLVADGPRSASELAAATGTHAPSLRRALRGLAAWGVLVEDSDGRFRGTAISEVFRADRAGLRNMVTMLSGEGYAAWGEVLYTLRTGKPAFDHVFGMTRWEKMAEDPEDAADFNTAMVEISRRVGRNFVERYDFADARTVVDVGGGNGALLEAVLKARPQMSGILFDLAPGLAGAADRMRSAGLEARVELVEGSFFESIPSPADLYMLKSIVHDWEEPRAMDILRACRSAMGEGSRLVLLERTMPERIDDPDAALGAVMSDLHMMVVLGGRERTPAEYGELLAESGLRMTRHIPLDPEFGVVEAVTA
ncbi:MAG TPA: methyltransferase [Candidatus Dormibacteraeota bacterium]|nr:methyltransferase [Candidatus Dormibacteraeota bacterium]